MTVRHHVHCPNIRVQEGLLCDNTIADLLCMFDDRVIVSKITVDHHHDHKYNVHIYIVKNICQFRLNLHVHMSSYLCSN